MAEHLDAALEIVDGDPLVRGVDELRRQLRIHRHEREEAVRDRAEPFAQEMAVGETRAGVRNKSRSGLELRYEGDESIPEGRLSLRARPAGWLHPPDVGR